jgi:hypothetical protein
VLGHAETLLTAMRHVLAVRWKEGERKRRLHFLLQNRLTGFCTIDQPTGEDDRPSMRAILSGAKNVYTPALLPVVSGLAKGLAVCDVGFSSVPTMTMPNPAFALAGTSQGHLDDHTKIYAVPASSDGFRLKNRLRDFRMQSRPLTQHDFPDTQHPSSGTFRSERRMVRCRRLLFSNRVGMRHAGRRGSWGNLDLSNLRRTTGHGAHDIGSPSASKYSPCCTALS